MLGFCLFVNYFFAQETHFLQRFMVLDEPLTDEICQGQILVGCDENYLKLVL